MQTVAQLLESAARSWPHRTMVRHRDQDLTYRDVDAWSSDLARALGDLGVRPGDPVALFLPSRPVFVAAYYGAIKAGAAAAPLNAMFTPDEVAAMTSYLGTSLVVTTPEYARPLLAAGVGGLDHDLRLAVWDVDGDQVPEGTIDLAGLARQSADRPLPAPGEPADVATIFHTSGTTGRPKGAAQTHLNVITGARQMVTHAGWRTATEHVVCPLPLFNNFGSTVVLNMTALTAATMTIVERWDAEEVLAAFADGATRMVGTPTMYIYLLGAHDPAVHGQVALDPCVVGGQTAPVETCVEFEERFGARLLNLYGATETHAVTLTPLHGPYPGGTVGHPVGQASVTVLDDAGQPVAPGVVGELALGGDTVCAGYWRDVERTAESFGPYGWLSGDLGFRDETGYVHVVDRKKDLIITGGANIYPAEIEAALHRHPAVALATVIGIPDPVKGEIPKAYVVRKAGAEIDEAGLMRFLREGLAAYKCPRAVEFTDRLPTSAVGKVLKRELREQVLADACTTDSH